MGSPVMQRLRERARALKADTLALYYAYRDPRVPWHARVVAVLVVAYALSPIDLIPDFIPVLGYLDDLILVPAGIALAIRLIPSDVMTESRARAREVMAEGKPVNWAAAAIIVVIWLLLAALTAWLVWRALRD